MFLENEWEYKCFHSFCGSILQCGYVYDTIDREIKQIKGVKLL